MHKKKSHETTKRAGRPQGSITTAISKTQLFEIEKMAGLGLNMTQMAAMLGMSKKSFERRALEDTAISDAIEKGRAVALLKVAATAYEMALSGEVPAMTMFYLKCRGGWKERSVQEVEITGVGENKRTIEFTDEQRRKIALAYLDLDEKDVTSLKRG